MFGLFTAAHPLEPIDRLRIDPRLALGGPGVQVVARRDGVLRRVGLRGPPVAVGGQRVVLPVVVAQQVLHAGHVLKNKTRPGDYAEELT